MAHSLGSSIGPRNYFGCRDIVHAILAEVGLNETRNGDLIIILENRWLVNNGREDEALQVLSKARGLPPDSDLVQIEFLCVVSLPHVRVLMQSAPVRSRPSTSLRKRRPRSNSLNIRMGHGSPASCLDSTDTSVCYVLEVWITNEMNSVRHLLTFSVIAALLYRVAVGSLYGGSIYPIIIHILTVPRLLQDNVLPTMDRDQCYPVLCAQHFYITWFNW